MKDYWLAKLISSVTEVDSRKRLQKSIYLLQQAGCPLQFRYILHCYGPYSYELASLVDQLDSTGIIKETREGRAYKSSVTGRGKKIIKRFEKNEVGSRAREALNTFIPKFVTLNKEELRPLELAATIAYFQEDDWTEAEKQTQTFKRVPPDDDNLKRAVKLARNFKSA